MEGLAWKLMEILFLWHEMTLFQTYFIWLNFWPREKVSTSKIRGRCSVKPKSNIDKDRRQISFLMLDELISFYFAWNHQKNYGFLMVSGGIGFDPSRPNPGRREKKKLNFYFHTTLRCLRRFYEGLKGLHKTFWGTAKNCESKNLF